MQLLDLPNELLDYISDGLESQSDLNSWARVDHRLHHLNNRELYRRNVRDSDSSALIWAAEHGRMETVQNVLREHKDKQAIIEVCKWPLCVASEHGHSEIVKVFLDVGVDINIDAADLFTENNGPFGTPLYRACEGSHEDLVLLLISKGADVNIKGRYQRCTYALVTVARKGHERLVLALLAAGADINAYERGGSTQHTALSVASAEGHIPIVKLLLEKGADVNAQYQYYIATLGKVYHGSPLLLPVIQGDTSMVRLLLEHGVDRNIPDSPRGNILQGAVEGNVEIMRLLLDTGLDVNAQGEHYLDRRNTDSSARLSSALYIAAVQGYTAMVDLLLERGADVNLRGGSHGNALCAAVFEGHEQAVEALTRERRFNIYMAHHDSSRVKQGFKIRALSIAVERGHMNIVRLLLDRGAVVGGDEFLYNKALIAAASTNRQTRRKMVNLLLQKGSGWTIWNLSGCSALLKTTTDAELYDIVELLIEVGANIEKAWRTGREMTGDERVPRIVSRVIVNQSVFRVWLEEFL